MAVRRIAIVLGGLGLVLAASGCGASLAAGSSGSGGSPLLRRLTEQRAYDQALCAAMASHDPERSLAYVGKRLDADARPRLHLHAVPRAELEAALGEPGWALANQAVLVRGVVAIDGVQVDDFGLRVALTGFPGPTDAFPASVGLLAGLMGESGPEDRVERIEGGRELVPERFRQRPLLGLAASAVEASTLFLVPVTLATGHTRQRPDRTIVTPPTDAEVLAAAPATSAVARAIARASYVDHGEGQEVASVWMWPRPEDDLELVIEWSYAAYGCAGRRPALRRRSLGNAEVVRTVKIPLPPGSDLESQINAVFGDRMRLLVP